MDAKLSKVYYSPQVYWKGPSAIKKLAEAAKAPEDTAKQWLIKQALGQIYVPSPRYIPRPKFDDSVPNSVHHADLLFFTTWETPAWAKSFQVRADRCRHC